MAKFAKLFETDKFGQIVVLLQRDDKGRPAVQFLTDLEDLDLGVCQISINYTEDDAGWDKAEAYFDTVDEETACKAAASIRGYWAEALENGKLRDEDDHE